jgi:hypothetical protein
MNALPVCADCLPLAEQTYVGDLLIGKYSKTYKTAFGVAVDGHREFFGRFRAFEEGKRLGLTPSQGLEQEKYFKHAASFYRTNKPTRASRPTHCA